MPIPRYPGFPTWTWAHRLSALSFTGLLVLGASPECTWLRGSMSATRMFGVVPFTDPLSALEVVFASRAVATELLLGAALVLIVYLLLGRAFCAWLCPFGLVTELFQSLRERVDHVLLRRWHRRLPRFEFPTWPRYYVLGLVLFCSFSVALPVFGMVSPLQWLVWAMIFPGDFGPLLVLLLVLGGWLLLELFAPRAFCRGLCPIGAFYTLLGKFSPLRIGISTDESQRKWCKQCSLHCPMGIDVMRDHVGRKKRSVTDPSCTRCGTCLDVCQARSVLHWTWVWPWRPRPGESRST